MHVYDSSQYFSPWVLFYSGEIKNLKSNLSIVLYDFLTAYWEIKVNKELDYKDRLIECEKLILPLLQNLMKNEDKEYIYWPNRKAIIQQQIDRLQKITQKT